MAFLTTRLRPTQKSWKCVHGGAGTPQIGTSLMWHLVLPYCAGFSFSARGKLLYNIHYCTKVSTVPRHVKKKKKPTLLLQSLLHFSESAHENPGNPPFVMSQGAFYKYLSEAGDKHSLQTGLQRRCVFIKLNCVTHRFKQKIMYIHTHKSLSAAVGCCS